MTRQQKHRDVARFLRQEGWSIDRQKGSHEIWKHPERPETLSIPSHHGVVSAGIVRQIQAVIDNTPQSWN